MMAAKDHLHDWAQTASGYVCLNCSASITQADIVANQGTDTNIQHLWKKSGH